MCVCARVCVCVWLGMYSLSFIMEMLKHNKMFLMFIIQKKLFSFLLNVIFEKNIPTSQIILFPLGFE